MESGFYTKGLRLSKIMSAFPNLSKSSGRDLEPRINREGYSLIHKVV